MQKGQNPKILLTLISRILNPQFFAFLVKNKSVMKLMFGLSIGFQNGMSWSHSIKTHKLVWVLGNGPFPDQGPDGGALGAGSLNLQYIFLLSKPWNFSLFHAEDQKLFHLYFQIDTHTHFASLYALARFFLYENLYLSLHYVP